jgi:hypothetical protein
MQHAELGDANVKKSSSEKREGVKGAGNGVQRGDGERKRSAHFSIPFEEKAAHGETA